MTSKFDDAAASYNRVRPEYPPPLIDALFDLVPDHDPLRTVEVGPATGQLTGALLGRGAHVTAVELGPSLAEHLARRFRRQPNLTVANARFEDAPLAEGAWDLVVSATAYHWVTPEARMTKPHALLVPGGLFAIIDTVQIASPVDRGYFERSHPIYMRYWPEQGPYRSGSAEDADHPLAAEMRESPLFEDVRIQRWRWDEVYTVERYEDLVRSYSNTNDLPPDVRERFIADIRAMVAEEDGGMVIRPRVAVLITGRRV
ncbi:MAG: class I SAM-dependent methyltransferase [Chloroflexi bacterium]|nr:class I SAM-dependent methyltransferase [Chloroflexota bacterium]MQC18850.1 class I SAM-dependent methyltransferase [Chloroflexota bacterium]